jgi:hypothetical protein
MEEWREHKIETQCTDIPVLILRMNHWKKMHVNYSSIVSRWQELENGGIAEAHG